MKSAEEWVNGSMPSELGCHGDYSFIKAIQADALNEPIKMLKKYQARYHGAEHAKEDWDRAQKILDDLELKLPKEIP